MLVGSGQRAINHGLLTIREEGLLDELQHFTKGDTEKFEAEVGYDDRVLALLLALRSREENYVERHTPIEVTDKNTRAVFGDYISVYDIQRAVEDKAAVPIYYESRLAKLALDETEKPHIDPEFEEVVTKQERDAADRLISAVHNIDMRPSGSYSAIRLTP